MPDTQITNPVRVWVERQIGRAMLVAIPTGLLFLAGWIWTVEGKIATIASSNKENTAQWKVLYENRKKVDDLAIEMEVNQRLFKMMVHPEHAEALLRKYMAREIEEETAGDEDKPDRPKIKRPVIIPYKRKIDDFKQEQIKNMQQQMQKPEWTK